MAYAIIQDLIDRHGEDTVLVVSDRDGDGVVDTTAVSDALDDASDEIDTYLAKRHSLPLATTPGVLTRMCGDIAIYRLADTADVLTDERRTRFEDALVWLKMAAKGTVSLGLEDEPASVSSHVEMSSKDRVFTRTSMRVF